MGRWRSTLLLLTLLVLLAIVLVVFLRTPKLVELITGPETLNAFQSVKLGSSMDEVRYARGGATDFFVDDEKSSDWGQRVVAASDLGKGDLSGKKDSDFVNWSWNESNRRVDVSFDPHTKLVTSVSCFDDKSAAACSVAGIATGDDEETALAVLGRDVAKYLAVGGSTLRVDSASRNLSLYLTKKKVYMIKVLDVSKDKPNLGN